MNLRAFIGSSSESLNIANAIKRSLHGEIDCTVWTDRFFKLSRTTIETLSTEVDNFDVGILVFGEDDALSSQGTSFSVTRDNVLFEYGLFCGRLGAPNGRVSRSQGNYGVLGTREGRATDHAAIILNTNTLSFSEPPHIRSQR
jgi:predicted nucleotide-binding protein